jgi:hypothetical protein
MNEALSKALFEQEVSGLTPRLLKLRNWKLYSREFPVLDVGFCAPGRPELRVRLRATNWNDQAASVELLNAEGQFLAQAPRHPVFNNSAHPITGRPFVCMAGAHEYHTHPSHLGDSWENYKGKPAFRLGELAAQIWQAWSKASP